MFEQFNTKKNKTRKIILHELPLFLLIILLCSCATKNTSNDNSKETSALGVDQLTKENDNSKKNYIPIEEEIGRIVFEIPGYYNNRSTNYDEFQVTFSSKGATSVGYIGFYLYDGIYAESAKNSKDNLINEFTKGLQNIKTEESMLANNYILKVIGSSDKCTIVRAFIVNDSTGTAVYIQLKVDETDPKNKNYYNDFINMIDNAIFKVDDLELVGGVKGTTTKSDGYGFSTYISGVVKNNTSKKYSYVQITFALFDKDGNKVGTALANVNSLDAGETWKFEALALKDFSTYKLDEITGW